MPTESQRTFRSKNLEMAGYMFFRNIRRKKEFCDVIFHIGGKTVSAHRIVVVAAIPYYQQLLDNKSGAYEENDDEKECSIPDDIDPDAFENLIEFAYSGEVMISNENVKHLLTVARHFDVKEVTEACCDFLVNNLDPENVFDIRNFANDLKCAELLKDVDEYICENFSRISQTEEFCSLPLQCVEELLKRDDLRVTSEEKVFASVMKWVNKCPEERKANLPELLKKVRMVLLDPLYLKNCVAERLIHDCILCRDLVDEARNYHFFPDHRVTLSYFSSEPRCKAFGTSSSTDDESIYVLSGGNTYTAQYFNQQEQAWKTKPGRNFQHVISFSAVVGAKIYYFHDSYLLEFDPPKNAYRYRKSMRYSKDNYGTASLNGKIYLCGGQNGMSYLKTVEYYDPEKDAWEDLSDMEECRSAPGVTTLAECIYVLGGTDGTSILKSVEKYDLLSRKWRAVPSMLTARRTFGCTTLNGRIYACGGFTTSEVNTPTAEVYDPMENKWMLISSMNTVRYSLKLLPYHGKLFAIGGKDDNNSLIYSVEIYDPNLNKWVFGKETNGNLITATAEVISSPPITKAGL